jgi:hypothetical protein
VAIEGATGAAAGWFGLTARFAPGAIAGAAGREKPAGRSRVRANASACPPLVHRNINAMKGPSMNFCSAQNIAGL